VWKNLILKDFNKMPARIRSEKAGKLQVYPYGKSVKSLAID
jgi:hypothetical protein